MSQSQKLTSNNIPITEEEKNNDKELNFIGEKPISSEMLLNEKPLKKEQGDDKTPMKSKQYISEYVQNCKQLLNKKPMNYCPTIENLLKNKISNKPENKSSITVKNSRARRIKNIRAPRMYKFLKESLNDPLNYSYIKWIDEKKGMFKFINSAEVARRGGLKKDNPSMKYEHFARSLRTYIAKGYLTKPKMKLVYCFVK